MTSCRVRLKLFHCATVMVYWVIALMLPAFSYNKALGLVNKLKETGNNPTVTLSIIIIPIIIVWWQRVTTPNIIVQSIIICQPHSRKKETL